MKNLINIYILLLLVVCSTLSSCSDWLDVNNNPNTAEKVEAGYLFNYAAVNCLSIVQKNDFLLVFVQLCCC